MSTREYLSKLDIDQLRFAKEEAERLISKIEDEKKITLFIVEGSCVNEACYSESEFHLAKIKLCELIMQDDFTEVDLGGFHPKISKIKVYESEVSEYMKLNT